MENRSTISSFSTLDSVADPDRAPRYVPLTIGSGLGIFVSDIREGYKKKIFYNFLACLFLKVRLHHFSNIKSHKQITKQ